MNWALLFYIIPAILAVASVVVIVMIYVRKLQKLSALDLDAMPVHRQHLRKTSLVEERFYRQWRSIKARVAAILKPIGRGVMAVIGGIYHKLRAKEERYRKESAGTEKASVGTVQSAGVLLEKAQALHKEENYAEAEKKYIEVIAIDNNSVTAYQGLAQVYVARKDFKHALETLQFLQQLNPKDEAVWRTIGGIYKDQDKLVEALDAYDRVLELAPNNPKNLDVYIELAIANQLKYKAQGALDTLKEKNPENSKLVEYQQQINGL